MTETKIETETAIETSAYDVVFRGRRVMTTAGELAREVGVRDGRIVAIEPLGHDLHGETVVELADDEVLLPGLVDSHVHVNEPGRTEWEGFASATRAALAGGVTTIVDMPLNSIPATTSPDALAIKRAAADGKVMVDVGFWGGAVPDNLGRLRALHEAGVFGFKCFLLDSGVPEFPPLDPDQLRAAMTEIAAFDGLLIVHAEDPQTIARHTGPGGPRYSDFLASRPGESETRAVATVVDAARATGCRCHIVHVSDADTAAMLASAASSGVHVTAETCPHYLTLTADDVPDGHTEFKCCPPVRSAVNVDRLWRAVGRREIDIVVSDHSPSTPDLKYAGGGDFAQAWGGIASLQLSLPLVWTEAHRRGFELARVVRWMSAGPARLLGLTGRKGSIVPGADADLVVFAPDEQFVVDAQALQHRHPVSPYDGKTLQGVARQTYLRGERITLDDKAHGTLLSPTPS